MTAKKKDNMPIWCKISFLHLLGLLLLADHLYLRSLFPFLIEKAKNKILTYYIEDGCKVELHFVHIFVNLIKSFHDFLQYSS